MKKVSIRITALIMCAVMCAALAACGGKSASVQDYLDKYKTQIDQTISDTEAQFGGAVELAIVARDNSLVYSYKYLIDIDFESAKASIEASMALQEDIFKETYKELVKVVPSATSVIVEYLDKDGNVITSAEYSN